jgi:Cu2+-containing amine oxidase
MLSSRDERKVTPVITLEIYNSGKGIVISRESIAEACSAAGISSEQKDIIDITATLSNKEMDCKKAELRERKAIIVCRLEEGISTEQGNFMSPLQIRLDYGYSHSISREVKINRLAKY